jgi:hypothetical protein
MRKSEFLMLEALKSAPHLNDLCFWPIPTVGFYRKHGEVTSPPSSRNYSTLILSACKRSAGGPVVVDVTMTASPPPASAVIGLSCQYWINLESIWLWSLLGSRREDDDHILWLSGAHHVQCTYRLSLSYNYSWQWSLLIKRKPVNVGELQSKTNIHHQKCVVIVVIEPCLSMCIRKGHNQW